MPAFVHFRIYCNFAGTLGYAGVHWDMQAFTMANAGGCMRHRECLRLPSQLPAFAAVNACMLSKAIWEYKYNKEYDKKKTSFASVER